jgi:phytoene/squalene synthetase
MSRAVKYREYAEECKRIARQLPVEQQKALLEIAEAWTRCAKDEERKNDRLKHGEGST